MPEEASHGFLQAFAHLNTTISTRLLQGNVGAIFYIFLKLFPRRTIDSLK